MVFLCTLLFSACQTEFQPASPQTDTSSRDATSPPWGTSMYQLRSTHGSWAVYCRPEGSPNAFLGCRASTTSVNNPSIHLVMRNDGSFDIKSTGPPIRSASLNASGQVVPFSNSLNSPSILRASGIRSNVTVFNTGLVSRPGDQTWMIYARPRGMLADAAARGNSLSGAVNSESISFSTSGFNTAAEVTLKSGSLAPNSLSELRALAMPIPQRQPSATSQATPQTAARTMPATTGTGTTGARANCTQAEVDRLIGPYTRRGTQMAASGRTPDILRSQQYVFTNVLRVFEDARRRCGGFTQEIAYAREQLATTQRQMQALGVR
jgi:hypothetical protein